MRNRIIEKAFNAAAGPATSSMCSVCKYPALQGPGLVLMTLEETFGDCPGCGGAVDLDGKPLAAVGADGKPSISIVQVSRMPEFFEDRRPRLPAKPRTD